jgi:hypothetical protein
MSPSGKIKSRLHRSGEFEDNAQADGPILLGIAAMLPISEKRQPFTPSLKSKSWRGYPETRKRGARSNYPLEGEKGSDLHDGFPSLQ